MKRERRQLTKAEWERTTSPRPVGRPVRRPEVPYTVRGPGPNGWGCPAERGEANEGRVGVSERDEEVRRAREEVEELEAARVRLSGDVMRGDVEARNEDRQLERRLRDLSRLIMRAEQEEKDELRAGTERRGEELRQAWRDNHPSQEEEREKGRPKKDRPS